MPNLQNGQSFTAPFLIKSVQYLTTKNQKPYISLTVSTKDQTLNAKLWDKPHQAFPDISGKVAMLSGVVEEYQNEPQLRVTTCELLDESDPLANPMLYLETAPIDPDTMITFINDVIQNKITNNMYKWLIGQILTKQPLENSFTVMPAAKVMHHAFGSGLLYHTYRMLQSAVQLTEIYPVDTDLVFTSVILHDAGKMLELSGPFDTEYTLAGQYLGHIAILDGWLVELMTAFGLDHNISLADESFVKLRSTLLSHHGKKEYGSPVTPVTKEALLLHHLDILDMEMTVAENALAKTEPGSSTSRIFALNQTQLIRSHENPHANLW